MISKMMNNKYGNVSHEMILLKFNLLVTVFTMKYALNLSEFKICIDYNQL